MVGLLYALQLQLYLVTFLYGFQTSLFVCRFGLCQVALSVEQLPLFLLHFFVNREEGIDLLLCQFGFLGDVFLKVGFKLLWREALLSVSLSLSVDAQCEHGQHDDGS